MKKAALILLTSCGLTFAQSPFQKSNPIEEKFKIIPFSDVKPTGWIKNQIQENLDGFTGNLDSLASDLIVKDDIYNKDRLRKNSKAKELGALGEGGDWQVQLYWWNSETQSNWWDGYIRSAILNADETLMKRVQDYINKILKTQDKDGYLGIYSPELRYNFDNENGELWAKATLLRGLLAWYEHSKDAEVLNAIEKAVQNTIDNYPVGNSNPFYSKNPNVGGLSHGLTFTDVLEQLFYLTKKTHYLDYALFLYQDFSEQVLNEDAQFSKLMQNTLPLQGHGVHTYEHLRSLAAAYYASGNPELAKALKNFEDKIKQTTTASGGPVGDEWIGGRKADATNRGYEYCSLQELLHSYASLFAKSGATDYGDKIETLFFNAAQGARHPEESCIAYLKSDNSYAMTGGLNGDESDKNQTRYRYSPVHREAAVCCVPNAGRIAPYYVQYMWLKEKNAIVASLLGPSELKTEINGKIVKISEKTEYPYANTIIFEVEAKNAFFDLKIRKPEWVQKFKLNVGYKEENGFIVISKKWNGKTKISLEFLPEVATKTDLNGEYFFTYGSLVLAHPIESVVSGSKKSPIPGFADLEYSPKDFTVYKFRKPYQIKNLGKLEFGITLVNPKTNLAETVKLLPMGKTILRQVTFKAHEDTKD